jgi:predicted RNA binding protein YcfA (HicA-like mRNA interferase family)
MSSKEKLVKRFLSLPRDFTFEEVIRLFALCGFVLSNKGHSSGSRVAFVHDDEVFTMHKPHPGNIVKRGTLRNIKEYLDDKQLLENGKTEI